MPSKLRIILAFGMVLTGLWGSSYWTPLSSFSQAIGASSPKADDPSTTIPAAPYQPIIYDIPYGEPAGPEIAHRQTLDLYLPVGSKTKPPLLIFIHGGFWTTSDDKYRIGPSLASALRTSGVAVAVIRYRLAPAYRHPAQAQDVAAAVATLVRQADQYGYDKQRIYLAGHSAGAHLAALVALDPGYLAGHQLDSRSLAGVVAISGIYNLDLETQVSESQRSTIEQIFGQDAVKAASPITHVRAGAPPFLILTAADDLDGFPIDARKFAEALRAKGNPNVQQLMVPASDHLSIARFQGENNLTRRLVLGFLKVEALPQPLVEWIEAKRKWIDDPPFSTHPFWEHDKLIRSYPVDERFVRMILFIYRNNPQELLEWPLKQYHAIDLFSYLDSLPKEGVGERGYLITTNIRGERQFWHREEIERYKPVIVVGIDDERNLFRFSVAYRMLREYSWKPGGLSPLLTLTLGAFIYFQEDPPETLRPQSWHYGLTVNSFRLATENPLAPVRTVPKDVYDALTYRNGCLYCHSFRGTGSRSHHVLAQSGKPHGGFALPLEDYPAEVWRNFIFNQEAVANKMGATPNIIKESARKTLYNLVVESRGNKDKPKTSGPPSPAR